MLGCQTIANTQCCPSESSCCRLRGTFAIDESIQLLLPLVVLHGAAAAAAAATAASTASATAATSAADAGAGGTTANVSATASITMMLLELVSATAFSLVRSDLR
jgi:hypothetical protein